VNRPYSILRLRKKKHWEKALGEKALGTVLFAEKILYNNHELGITTIP
jgi:hypothetical protein